MNPAIDSVEVYYEAGAQLGEGPLWDEVRDQLLWVDIERCEIHTLTGGKHETIVTLAESIGSAVPLRSGLGWIVGLRSGVAVITRDGAIINSSPIDMHRDTHRMNDGACDSAGRFWTGTMDEGGGPPSDALYCVGHGLDVTSVVEGLGTSNGIAWSPDDRWMYHVDSAAGTIFQHPFDPISGALGPRSPIVSIESSTGEPDGIATDTSGGLWVAIWDGWCVQRYHPSGELDRVVELPVARPTSCAFGGRDRSELFITSARTGLPPRELEDQPFAGHLFRVELPYMGLQQHPFG